MHISASILFTPAHARTRMQMCKHTPASIHMLKCRLLACSIIYRNGSLTRSLTYLLTASWTRARCTASSQLNETAPWTLHWSGLRGLQLAFVDVQLDPHCSRSKGFSEGILCCRNSDSGSGFPQVPFWLRVGPGLIGDPCCCKLLQ